MRSIRMVLIYFFAISLISPGYAQRKLDEDTKKEILRRVRRMLKVTLKEMRKEVKEIVKEELEKANKRLRERGPDIGVDLVELTGEERQRLGLEEGTGIKIGDVKQGGLGERAGLQKGDIVIEIAGQRATKEVLLEALKGLKPGDSLNLRILREKRIEIKIQKEGE